MAEQRVVIVGTRFLGKEALAHMGTLMKGESLTLHAEPDNPVDPSAIAVCRDGTKIGYIPKHATSLRNAMADGVEFTATVSSEPIMQDGQCIELPRITVKWEKKDNA